MITPERTRHISNPNIAAIALATASLAIAGCGNEQKSPEQPSEGQALEMIQTAATTRAKTIPAEDCSFHYVTPGQYFSPKKSAGINKDLTVLRKIHTPKAKVGFRDIGTATGMVYDSFKDPLYADAIVKTNKSVARGKKVTVKSFLSTKVRKPEQCDDNHISKKDARAQYQQATSIGQTLLRGIGVKVKEQGSSLAERSLDKMEQVYDNLKDKYQQELN